MDPVSIVRANPVKEGLLPLEGIDERELARLIADGEIPFPTEADERDQQRLAELVRAHRTARLVQFLARVISIDLEEEISPKT